MRKTVTQGGDRAYAINLSICFTIQDFARALAERQWIHQDIDFDSLTKEQSLRILRHSLEFNGRHGAYQGLETIGDDQDLLNDIYQQAKVWVGKKFPYLAE